MVIWVSWAAVGATPSGVPPSRMVASAVASSGPANRRGSLVWNLVMLFSTLLGHRFGIDGRGRFGGGTFVRIGVEIGIGDIGRLYRCAVAGHDALLVAEAEYADGLVAVGPLGDDGVAAEIDHRAQCQRQLAAGGRVDERLGLDRIELKG